VTAAFRQLLETRKTESFFIVVCLTLNNYCTICEDNAFFCAYAENMMCLRGIVDVIIYSILLFRAVQTFFFAVKTLRTMKMHFSGGFQFFIKILSFRMHF
jgi:hypothetical protein